MQQVKFVDVINIDEVLKDLKFNTLCKLNDQNRWYFPKFHRF